MWYEKRFPFCSSNIQFQFDLVLCTCARVVVLLKSLKTRNY